MDNSFSKAMETVAGAVWSQLMLKGKAEVSVNGVTLTTLSLDVRVQEDQVSSGAGRSNLSPISPTGSSNSNPSMTPPPPPPPSSMSGFRSGGSGSE